MVNSIRTHEYVQQGQKIIDESPQKSMRSITKYLGDSKAIILRIIYENFPYKSYVCPRSPEKIV